MEKPQEPVEVTVNGKVYRFFIEDKNVRIETDGFPSKIARVCYKKLDIEKFPLYNSITLVMASETYEKTLEKEFFPNHDTALNSPK